MKDESERHISHSEDIYTQTNIFRKCSGNEKEYPLVL